MHTKFRLENLKGRNHSEDLDVDGDNIKTDNLEIGWKFVHWTSLAQDKDPCRLLCTW
jgi:hypothetical protein